MPTVVATVVERLVRVARERKVSGERLREALIDGTWSRLQEVGEKAWTGSKFVGSREVRHRWVRRVQWGTRAAWNCPPTPPPPLN